jgi:membrane fusion protein, copper/silver efflux system
MFALGGWAAHRWGPILWGEEAAMAEGMAMGDSQQADPNKKILYWKSSMVAGEIHKGAGKDSMGMDLVPVYEGEGGDAKEIKINPATELNMGVRIGSVVEGPLVQTVRTVGYVDYDETTLGAVTTKIDGWIEKLYVDETGAQVHVGDPLFELYSPKLFSAQEEFLVALKNLQTTEVSIVPRSKFDSEGLLQDARTRLEYFDIPSSVIDEIAKSGVAKKTMTLFSPFTGIVTHKGVVEGQKVSSGENLMRIADLSRVWVQGRVYEYDLPYVKVGQQARMTLSYIPGKTFLGKVTYIYPYLEEGTREISVRMEFFNPGYELKPGMYATIKIRSELDPKVTLVDDVAIIDTGDRSVAFIAKGSGRFQLRNVSTGLRSENNRVQVLAGLEPGDQVVLSGQFLLDSESRLREAALKFLDPEPKPGTAMSAEQMEAMSMSGQGKGETSVSESAPKNMAPEAEQEHFVCPMPEHSTILYDAPGDCPICGKSMGLVPKEGAVHESKKTDKADGNR